ncbi:MAG: DUF1844 domain-containing protein [Candidatus Omnitrophica bacterium]|nr:DUF1844 domain-containing protein [Candidatus Omnitrophota bacterium]
MSKEKYVDESWKEHASEEKDKLADTVAPKSSSSETPQAKVETRSSARSDKTEHRREETHEIEVNFLNYITSLGFQAMIFMGEIPNPVTDEREKNMTQAKFLIDTLAMLKEKTAGNLNDQERDLLENSIYELQMRYVQLVEKEEPN